jgi:hypothetical protein
LISIHNIVKKRSDLSEVGKLMFYERIDNNVGKTLINAARMINGAVWVSAGIKAIKGDDLLSR